MKACRLNLLVVVLLASLLPKPACAFILGDWQNVATWSNPRGLGMSAVDPDTGTIYLLGGHNQGAIYATSAADAYDPLTGSWTSLAPMPMAVRGASAVLSGGKIYVYGGYERSAYIGIQIYDIALDTWTTQTPEMIFPVFGNGSSVVGGLHYIQGGEVPWSPLFERDPDAGTMTRLPDAPSTHYLHGFLSYGSTLYAFGGLVSPADVNSPVTAANDAYDIAAGTWTDAPADMPTPSAAFASSTDGRYFYVAGGGVTYLSGTPPFLDQFVIYDPVADAWQTGPALPEGLRDAMGVVANGRFYVFGGNDTDGFSGEVYAIAIPEPSASELLLGGSFVCLWVLGRRVRSVPANAGR